MYNTIKSFNEITLTKLRPLIICDIDSTVICPKKDISYYINNIKKILNEMNDTDITEDEIINEATTLYLNNYYIIDNIKATDKKGFQDVIDKVNLLDGTLIFLTSRKKTVSELTERTLHNILNIDTNIYKIYYTENKINKGQYIKNNLMELINKYDDVIFIDDDEKQIKSIYKLNKYLYDKYNHNDNNNNTNNNNNKITCYRFEI